MAFLLRALLVVVVALVGVSGRASAQPAILAVDDTFAEMRTIKGDVTVTPAGEAARAPYPRERLAEGAACKLGAGGLAWLRRDAGAIVLVVGPAQLTFHRGSIAMTQGKAFVDTNDGPATVLDVPHGHVELSDARASAEVHPDGTADVYVLRGTARAGSDARASPGEMLTVKADGSSTRAPEVAWDDWTGGLATADRAAEPAPFGVGTVGARPPGDQGKPRFSLVVQRLDVRVFVDHDFAVTEVDETFVNPSSDTVEGIFSFRTPPGATLQRFGVDRHGEIMWGRIKESAAALAQYQSNVYQGSTEDPALLVWTAPGVYSARLYPIQPGAQRRVVTRYSEWLPRQGPKGERRLYVYPMAAEGARGSLPRIEELSIDVNLARSGAERVRTGMGGVQEGGGVVIKAFDVVPLADVAVELFDGGQSVPVAYRASHGLTQDEAPEQSAPDFAARVSREEPDYLLVPVRTTGAARPPDGIDLALVVDTSAATEAGALGIARNLASALLAQLGPSDRAALWSGDAKLHPVVDGSGTLTTLDDAKRRGWLDGLAAVDRGGATDLGALLTDAAAQLDPKRRGAVVYIGDGQPSVGELAPQALRDRLARLPQGTRIFTAALGSHPNSALLQSIARGAPMEVVSNAYGAASAALRLLEAAYRPTWVGATVDLGPGIERVFPRDVPAVGPDDSVLLVGRIVGTTPAELTVRGAGQTLTRPLQIVPLSDFGDLRRRWGEGRLQELLESGSGRAAVVDVGRRYGVVSPFTSLYVPTERETVAAGDSNLEEERESRLRRWKPWWHSAEYYTVAAEPAEAANADNKEGGTGTRAKGEEGSMGNPNTTRERALHEAVTFGMIGLIDQSGAAPGQATEDIPRPSPAAMATAAAAPAAALPPTMNGSATLRALGGGGAAQSAPAARPPAHKVSDGEAETAKDRFVTALGGNIGDAYGAGGLGLSGAGNGGGGRGQGIGAAHAVGTPRLGAGAPSEPPTTLASLSHTASACSPAADLPFDDRQVLWRERLASASSVGAVLAVYTVAVGGCEAPSWRERAALLVADGQPPREHPGARGAVAAAARYARRRRRLPRDPRARADGLGPEGAARRARLALGRSAAARRPARESQDAGRSRGRAARDGAQVLRRSRAGAARPRRVRGRRRRRERPGLGATAAQARRRLGTRLHQPGRVLSAPVARAARAPRPSGTPTRLAGRSASWSSSRPTILSRGGASVICCARTAGTTRRSGSTRRSRSSRPTIPRCRCSWRRLRRAWAASRRPWAGRRRRRPPVRPTGRAPCRGPRARRRARSSPGHARRRSRSTRPTTPIGSSLERVAWRVRAPLPRGACASS